jgi:hypothetical protein
MKLSVYTFFSLLLLSVCSCQRPASTSGSANQTDVISYPSECQHLINTFNEISIYKITYQLQQVNERRNGMPEDLKALYPDARNAWNDALDVLSSSGLETYQGAYSDWKNKDLSNSQKFFFLLTQYAEGDYPQGTKDTQKLEAWIESADIKKRFNTLLMHVQRSCSPVSLNEVKTQLPHAMLPVNIEDCLKK